MTDLLTTRQVQEILKVDRITIYRMLQDGRLKGVKIGQQWRFARREVERLLQQEVVLTETRIYRGRRNVPNPLRSDDSGSLLECKPDQRLVVDSRENR
jgi:excisionase family DNA binding protein